MHTAKGRKVCVCACVCVHGCVCVYHVPLLWLLWHAFDHQVAPIDNVGVINRCRQLCTSVRSGCRYTWGQGQAVP